MSRSRVAALLDELYFNAQTQRGKGTSFERLVRQFLLTDPRYAERFDEVWMWRDWPDRGTRPDRGVDLVAREREAGDLCAVQCKFYDPQSQVRVMSTPSWPSRARVSSPRACSCPPLTSGTPRLRKPWRTRRSRSPASA